MPNAIIHELLNLTPTIIREMQELMSHLSDTPCTEDALQQVVSTPNCHVYVAELEGRIVGTATLCLFASPLGAKASVEDVVVHPEYRGQHLGRQLMAHLLEASRQYAPLTLQLTSRSSRQAARALYASLGFKLKNTDFFTLSPQAAVSFI